MVVVAAAAVGAAASATTVTGAGYAIDLQHHQRRTPSSQSIGRRIRHLRSPALPTPAAAPRVSLSVRRRQHRRSTLELRQQPGVNAAIERQLYEAIATRPSPMHGSRAELRRTLRGTRLSFSSLAVGGTASAAPLPSCSEYSPQLLSAPLLQLQQQQQQQRRRTAAPISWRRTAGRRSSIIAEMRTQRPSIGSSARKRRTPGQPSESRWAHLQRARQQQRSQQFERGRTMETGDEDDDDIDDGDGDDDEDVQLLVMDDVFAVGATASDVAEHPIDRWMGRESGLSCAPDTEFEYSQHSATSFERLLRVKPSAKPFHIDADIDGDMDAVRDVDPRRVADGPADLRPQHDRESTVIWQYLDRTRSIESLRSSTSASFRVGTIPVRKNNAGADVSMASSRANLSSVSQRSADTSHGARDEARRAVAMCGELWMWTVVAAMVGLLACAVFAVLRS